MRWRGFIRRRLARLNWLLIIVLIVPDVIIVERAAGIVALQRAAIRCVVTRGRQRQSRVERKLENVLDQTLAKTGFADHQSAPMILNCSRHNLGSRRSVAIDQDH